MSLLIFLILLGAFFALIVSMAVMSQQNRTKAKARQPYQTISDAGVRDLVAQGRIDEAIDLYQRFTGVDLFTAQDAVADMQRELQLSNTEADIRRRLRLGDKAGAIEKYQQATGADLKESLAAIEAMEQTHE